MESQFSSLDTLIEKSSLECLNEDPKYPVTNCLVQPNPELETRSLDDAELLIKWSFTCPVKIGQLMLRASRVQVEEGSYPSKIHLYVNQPELDFSNWEDIRPKETLTFTKEDVLSGKKIELRLAKFQNVRNMGLFIPSNAAECNITRIGYIALFGMPESTLDMKAWKPSEAPAE